MTITQTKYWKDATKASSCDLYSSCGLSATVNSVFFGKEVPHSGSTFAAFVQYCPAEGCLKQVREYLLSELKTPLEPDSKYLVEFYLNLPDSFVFFNNKIGAYFAKTNDTIGLGRNDTAIILSPQIINKGSGIIPKTGWLKVSDTMDTHIGGERFIIIGNFESYPIAPKVFAYLFIDDISVIKIGNVVGMKKLEMLNAKLEMNMHENVLFIQNNSSKNYNVKVFNLFGATVFEKKNIYDAMQINFNDYNNGIYFIQIENDEGIFQKKILKSP